MPIDLDRMQVTVMGLGRFGGGVGVTKWLASRGSRVLLTDLRPPEDLRPAIAQIQPLIDSGAVRTVFGEHRQSDFTDCDLIVANPAVPMPWDNEYLQAARDAGVPITTEIRLTIEHLDRSRVIGVTGSLGKSTTVAMIAHALRAMNQPCHHGGNFGGSLLPEINSIKPTDWIVLELSSFMLWWLSRENGEGWSPGIAVLTNLEPNHLDWHGTFEHYQDCKQQIFRDQAAGAPGDVSLREADAADVSPALSIPGEHNLQNARLAIAAVCAATSQSPNTVADTLSDFRGLPHRLAFVAERDGLRFFDDAKSSTPQATLLAVRAFDDPSRIHLIAGGYDKGIDLSQISSLSGSLAGIYTIGATGQSISADDYCQTLDVAFERAISKMRPGDILLLSPGCASWDQYPAFDVRGKAYCDLVAKHAHA